MKEGFTITCNKCDSKNVDVQYYEDKTVYECKDCGQFIMNVVIEDY